jgi:hypothetical protein
MQEFAVDSFREIGMIYLAAVGKDGEILETDVDSDASARL